MRSFRVGSWMRIRYGAAPLHRPGDFERRRRMVGRGEVEGLRVGSSRRRKLMGI